MKKLMMTLGMLVATMALSGMTAQAETVAIKKVIAVPGASQIQVLEKVKTWAGKYGRVYNVDAKTGVVTASGEITYPSPPVDRVQYTILFEMKNKVQGNKDTVTFEKVMLKSPTQYLENGPPLAGQAYPLTSKATTKKDVAAVNKTLTYITANLEAFLLEKSDAACPLVKCPDCSVLCPSEGDMQEHMKGHPGHKTAPIK